MRFVSTFVLCISAILKRLIIAFLVSSLWFAGTSADCLPAASESKESVPFVLTRSDIHYGEKQVQQMLRDRPAMANYVKEGDAVWLWAARQFAGESTSSRYAWEAHPKFQHQRLRHACHEWPHDGHSGWLTVENRDDDQLGGESMWNSIVFELLNIRNDRQFRDLCSRVYRGGPISKAAFTKQVANIEYQTTYGVIDFYYRLWYPTLTKKGIAPKESIWSVHPRYVTFDEWFDWCAVHDPAYLTMYGEAYDRLMEASEYSESSRKNCSDRGAESEFMAF